MTFRRKSNGSAMAIPRSSIELSVSRTVSSSMSTCVPSAFVAASAAVCLTTPSPKKSQNIPRAMSSSVSGMSPCHRTMRRRAGRGCLSVALSSPGGYGEPGSPRSVGAEPGVDIVRLGGGDSVVEARASYALAERGAIARDAVASDDEDRERQREPDDEAPENDAVVEVGV